MGGKEVVWEFCVVAGYRSFGFRPNNAVTLTSLPGPLLRVCAVLPAQVPFCFPFPFLCHVHGLWSVSSFWTMNFHKQGPCLSNSPVFLAPATGFMRNNFSWTWEGQGGAWFGAWGFPGGSFCKESACNVGDLGSILGSGWSPGEGIDYPFQCFLASPMAQMVKNPPAMQETWVRSLVREIPLENGMATHSSILSWRIPWTEEPGRLQSKGSRTVVHDWVTNIFTFKCIIFIVHCISIIIIFWCIMTYIYNIVVVSGVQHDLIFTYLAKQSP